jgi:hypothetical protein
LQILLGEWLRACALRLLGFWVSVLVCDRFHFSPTGLSLARVFESLGLVRKVVAIVWSSGK